MNYLHILDITPLFCHIKQLISILKTPKTSLLENSNANYKLEKIGHLTKENIQIAKRHMKRCSTSFFPRKLLIKISLPTYESS